MLNAAEIAARRIPIDEAVLSLGKVGNWLCHYCNKRLNSEMVFMRHACEPKRRMTELASPLGQAAFGFYREWMKMKKFSQPGAAAFMESKYYRSFINFAQLVMDANISKPEKYMALMVEADVQPMLWCRDQCYTVYLDWMDKLQDPIDQVQDSINYLLDICEKESSSLDKIFEHLGAQRVLSLIRQRRLTPWLLFCSASFGSLLKTLDKSQLGAFNVVVNSGYWANRFQKDTSTVAQIKVIAKELGL